MDQSSLRSTSTHVLVDPEQLGALSLDDDTVHHLRRVLRLRDGEQVGVTDGGGRWLLASVRVEGSSLTLEAASEMVTEPPRTDLFTLAVAMPKGDRLDWLVQKVTELGVDRLVLVHAERSVVRWKPDRVQSQLLRLRRIADEACRQSRRVWRVEIDAPVEASTLLGDFVVAEPGGRRLESTDRSLAIGPEGGWSQDELATARDRVSLGSNILRTETAAVAATALCVAFER
ncbi:MAG TPA: RsmE family RNA methyltransferase [Ilumatobacteraceae bacterium]|nr:RsmE family RNA methyltransferase [Ilumatobacteraceae bacterium]